MTLNDIWSGSFNAFKKFFKLYLLLGLIPNLVNFSGLLILGGIALIFRDADGAGVVGSLFLAGIIIAIISTLVSLRVTAMTSRVTSDLTHGISPQGLGDTWQKTRGVLGRMIAPVMLLFFGFFISYAILAFIFLGVFSTVFNSSSGGSGSGGNGAGLLGIIVLIFFGVLLIPLLGYLFFATRLYPLLPVLANEEQHGGLNSLSRSWQLTRGVFWRTLGYLLLIGLAIGAIGALASNLSSLPFLPSMAQNFSVGPNAANSANPAQMFLEQLLPQFAASSVVGFLLGIVTTPFYMIYQTLYYVDLTRRKDHPEAFSAQAYPPGYAPYPPYPTPYTPAPGYIAEPPNPNAPGNIQAGPYGQAGQADGPPSPPNNSPENPEPPRV